nr:MAG TPA: hypothetical protein [Caudoviricetes sp.]
MRSAACFRSFLDGWTIKRQPGRAKGTVKPRPRPERGRRAQKALS